MRRHGFDALSFIFGAVITVIAGTYLFQATLPDVDAVWVVAAALLAIGLLVTLRAVRSLRKSPTP